MNARDIAVDAITAFRKRDAWSDGFLRNKIRAAKLDSRDAALATEIVNGVLQNLYLINFYIETFSSVKFSKIAPGILDILQVAVYQIVYLDRIPDSAAINDAVNRAKRNNPRAAVFVNAITRKISSQKNNLPSLQCDDFEKFLSVQYSHPMWIVKALMNVYGREETEKILSFNNIKHRISARVNILKTTTESLLDNNELFEKGSIENSVYINFKGSIENTSEFQNGCIYIQDLASQIAASTLSPCKGASVLDACAAPGGKSFLMAQLMENTGKIFSCDIYEHKLRLIEDTAARLGKRNISTVLRDSSVFFDEWEEAFDFILADVPCSGFGIIRKKPDIRYKDETSINQLPELQLKILNNVSRYLKRGGTLLYSTCTILPQENECVVDSFLEQNKDYEEVDEYFDIPCIKNKYGVTLLPHISGTDGFYMCKLRRKI